jgi:hypothetical protein
MEVDFYKDSARTGLPVGYRSGNHSKTVAFQALAR